MIPPQKDVDAQRSWDKKRLLLVVSGGVSAYKILDFIRIARQKGADVKTILTKGGSAFLTPLSISSLSQNQVYQDLLDPNLEAEIGHIALARWADVFVIAPATAHILAKMAHGLADDLATTALLATQSPVVVVPAMNVHMWAHRATQDNVRLLKERGVLFCGPEYGPMACGDVGLGRLAAVDALVSFLEAQVFAPGGKTDVPMKGMKVLITAGPTREPIDPVRFLTNRSSGKQGYALARAARDLGAEVILISGPVALPPPDGVRCHRVETAREMKEAVFAHLPCDFAFFTAAVCDWTPRFPGSLKGKKQPDGTPPNWLLEQTPDILKEVASHPSLRPGCVVGFAAETDHVEENAREKYHRKRCDLLVANDVSERWGGVFDRDVNRVFVITPKGEERWPEHTKQGVARRLLESALRVWQDRGTHKESP